MNTPNLSDLIAACGITRTAEDITTENFPAPHELVLDCTYKAFAFVRDLAELMDLKDEITEEGYRHANIWQLLHFGSKHPMVGTVLGMGTTYQRHMGWYDRLGTHSMYHETVPAIHSCPEFKLVFLYDWPCVRWHRSFVFDRLLCSAPVAMLGVRYT